MACQLSELQHYKILVQMLFWVDMLDALHYQELHESELWFRYAFLTCVHQLLSVVIKNKIK
jgi:hypothetical protein